MPRLDEELRTMALRLTPAERLQWLEETVEELLPWLGLASGDIRTVPTHESDSTE